MKRKEIFRRTHEDDVEYDPSMEEIRGDAALKRDFDEALDDIERQLKGGPSWVEQTPMHPSYVDDMLVYMHVDLDQINERAIRTQIAERITALEKKVFLQFIPFLKLQVDNFGYSNSPLEGNRTFSRAASADPIEQYFCEARNSHVLSVANPEDLLTYTLEIDRLEQKFGRYRRERKLYTFEKMEREIWQALDQAYWKSMARKETSARHVFDDVERRHHDQGPLFRIQKVIEVLQLLVEDMEDRFIRAESEKRVACLLGDIEYIKAHDAKKMPFSKPEPRENVGWAFETLGVSEQVTEAELRTAYRKAARANHPDLNPTQDDTRMQDINAAYDFIVEVKGFGGKVN